MTQGNVYLLELNFSSLTASENVTLSILDTTDAAFTVQQYGVSVQGGTSSLNLASNSLRLTASGTSLIVTLGITQLGATTSCTINFSQTGGTGNLGYSIPGTSTDGTSTGGNISISFV